VTIASIRVRVPRYNAGYVVPFGGLVPGPRFLIPILPFLAVPLALAFRRLPLTTLTAAGVSAALMVAVTIRDPLLAFDGVGWYKRILAGSLGIHSLASVVALCTFAIAAAAFAVRASSLWIRLAELPVTLAAGRHGRWSSSSVPRKTRGGAWSARLRFRRSLRRPSCW
jgi:hypothetical protein